MQRNRRPLICSSALMVPAIDKKIVQTSIQAIGIRVTVTKIRMNPEPCFAVQKVGFQ